MSHWTFSRDHSEVQLEQRYLLNSPFLKCHVIPLDCELLGIGKKGVGTRGSGATEHNSI